MVAQCIKEQRERLLAYLIVEERILRARIAKLKEAMEEE